MEERKSRYELFLEEEARKAQPTKRCSKCGVVKAMDAFNKHYDAVMSECRECHRRRYKRKYKNDEDRFWKHYWGRVQSVEDCLEWQGATLKDGRPTCRWNGKNNQRVRRVMYQLLNGALSDDEFITVSCHNIKCVRHSHLIKVNRDEYIHWGTPVGDQNGVRLHPDSLHRGDAHWSRRMPEKMPRGDQHYSRKRPDKLSRGAAHYSNVSPERLARGERSGQAKLTDDKVREIRQSYVRGVVTLKELANRYGVDKSLISLVVKKKIWAHVE